MLRVFLLPILSCLQLLHVLYNSTSPAVHCQYTAYHRYNYLALYRILELWKNDSNKSIKNNLFLALDIESTKWHLCFSYGTMLAQMLQLLLAVLVFFSYLSKFIDFFFGCNINIKVSTYTNEELLIELFLLHVGNCAQRDCKLSAIYEMLHFVLRQWNLCSAFYTVLLVIDYNSLRHTSLFVSGKPLGIFVAELKQTAVSVSLRCLNNSYCKGGSWIIKILLNLVFEDISNMYKIKLSFRLIEQ